MGFFDNLKNSAVSSLKQSTNSAVNNATQNAFYNATGGNKDGVGKGKNSSQTFTFSTIPNSVAELQAFPESCLDSPFKTTALVLLVLCNFERNENTTYEMLDFLKGPESVSGYEKQFIKERLAGKYYKPFSYFAGTSPKNGYIPTEPFTITVYENPYSVDNENWAIMWVKSSGADTERQVKLRRKPSTNQWFLNEILCLSDIRIPESEDPWA
jgi:hypothetical protein